MNIDIPVAPAIVLTLVGFFAPYLIALLNGLSPFVSGVWRRVVAVAASVTLGALGLGGYYLFTGEPFPASPAAWVTAILLVVVVCQTSYGIILKGLGADWITRRLSGDGYDAQAARLVSRANRTR